MILRLVKMHFRPEETAGFLDYFETIKNQIQDMPGILKLKLYQDVNDKNIVFTHSIWLNSESLENYRNSEAFSEIWPTTKALFASKPMAWSLKLK
jgi:quinol monooxygenase YgiN